MGERDRLKKGLVTQFSFLASELGFRGPRIADRSLLLTLHYRSDVFDIEIVAELRDWFLDFHIIPHQPVPAADGGARPWITSYELIAPLFSAADKALFNKAVKAAAPREARGSVGAMLEAAGYLAEVLRSLLPRLQAQPDLVLTSAKPA